MDVCSGHYVCPPPPHTQQFDDVGSKSMAEHFFEFFVDWSRSRENVSAIDLAEILDKCGIFVEATRLDRLGKSCIVR